MTPKEKANELIQKFTSHCISNLGGDQTYANAKQCALICVEEIIQALDAFGYQNTMWDDFETGQIRTEGDPCEYWQQVKSEL